ncbi:hypothetical protein BH11ACT8_BH11ACT8_06730 [soil metagenome]
MCQIHGARFVPDVRRSGISAAINTGLEAGAGNARYFAWLGDDDLLSTGSLRRTFAALEANQLATMAFGWCDYVDPEGAVVFRNRAGRLAAATVRFGPNLIPQPGSLMRRNAVVAVGGLDESLRYSMDLDLFLRLRSRGPLLSVPHTLASFRWHPDSTTVANGRESMEESDRVRMRYMSRSGANLYEVARWPGRWALAAAKWRATRNASKRVIR